MKEPCPYCSGKILGLDVVYDEGACCFCQLCGARGPRVTISTDPIYADQLSRATSAWNEWAEVEALKQQTLPEGGYINDTRLSG